MLTTSQIATKQRIIILPKQLIILINSVNLIIISLMDKAYLRVKNIHFNGE